MSSSSEHAIDLGTELLYQRIFLPGYSVLNKNIRFKDFLYEATSRYVRGLVERFDNVKIPGMSHPIRLSDLYVRVAVLKKISAQKGDRLEDLEKDFDRAHRQFITSRETYEGERIVNTYRKFVILGRPGAGKTTFLRYLVLRMLSPESEIDTLRLPIFINLHDWSRRGVQLKDYITEQFFSIGFMEASDFLIAALERGHCFIVFDGLDEVSQPSEQDRIISQIIDLTDKYGHNQYIISCRVAAYNYWFEHFADVEIADFNDQQAQQFINNWFRDKPQMALKCWNKLVESPQLKELATVPLLLNLLCIVYKRYNKFPANRANLYEEAVDILLRDWDSMKRIHRDDAYRRLSITRKKEMFGRIAWGTFYENMYFIPERILLKQIQRYVEQLPGAMTEDTEPDSKAILKSIEVQHGIFVERSKGIFSFAHLSFQEFFTAQHLVENNHDGLLDKMIDEHFFDDHWREVFILCASLAAYADEQLIRMGERLKKSTHHTNAAPILKMMQDLLLPGQYETPILVRKSACLVIFLANAESFISSRRHLIAEPLAAVLNKTRDLHKAILSFYENLNIHEGEYDEWGDYYHYDTERVYHYDPGKFKTYLGEVLINQELLEALNRVLNANLLLIDCLRSDVRLSEPFKGKILEALLSGEG